MAIKIHFVVSKYTPEIGTEVQTECGCRVVVARLPERGIVRFNAPEMCQDCLDAHGKEMAYKPTIPVFATNNSIQVTKVNIAC